MVNCNKTCKITAIVLICIFCFSFFILTPQIANAEMPSSGYNYDATEKKYIDYSGKGTVINGIVADGIASVNDSIVNVPVYKGGYQAGALDWWIWHAWSGWSVSNNKTNNYEKYVGDTTTEYDVQSRTEYRYQRYETKDVYSTKYYTTYQGTQWYNFWIVYTTSNWSGFGGNVSNYKITSTYTKQEKSGTKQELVRSDWQTSAPFRWFWEDEWTVYTSRTTYRYRSRTMKWSDRAGTTTEQVPLYYSLYDKTGKPIQGGIHWRSSDTERKISGRQQAIDTDLFYVTSKKVMNQIRQSIMQQQISYFSSESSLIDFITKKLINSFTEMGLVALAKKVSIGKLGVIDMAMLEYIDVSSVFNDQAAFVEYIAKLNTAIESTEKCSIVLSFTHIRSGEIWPSRKLRLGLGTMNNVSMLYNSEFCLQEKLEYYLNDSCFGTVSYLTEDDMGEEIEFYLTKGLFSWETIYPWRLS